MLKKYVFFTTFSPLNCSDIYNIHWLDLYTTIFITWYKNDIPVHSVLKSHLRNVRRFSRMKRRHLCPWLWVYRYLGTCMTLLFSTSKVKVSTYILYSGLGSSCNQLCTYKAHWGENESNWDFPSIFFTLPVCCTV